MRALDIVFFLARLQLYDHSAIAPSKYAYITFYMTINYYLLDLLYRELFMMAVAHREARRPAATKQQDLNVADRVKHTR